MKFRDWQTFRNRSVWNGWPLSVEVCIMDCCCYLLADFQKHPLKWIVIDLWNEYKPVPVVMFYLGQGKIVLFLEHWELLFSHQIGYRYFTVQHFYLITNVLASIMISDTCCILYTVRGYQRSFNVIDSI